uniref:Uncharacterized protein n=1 Tax=Heterorhabditis bacteriophora TaxID=37862 RepID=A0A1I7W953_HETBA
MSSSVIRILSKSQYFLLVQYVLKMFYVICYI